MAFWRPGEVDTRWATGVRATLRWLLGAPGQQAPAELPVRRADGTTRAIRTVLDAPHSHGAFPSLPTGRDTIPAPAKSNRVADDEVGL